MITVEDIPVENINSFWPLHYAYPVEDGIVTDEDKYGPTLMEKGAPR